MHLIHFRFRDLIGVYAAKAFSLLMNFQHYIYRFLIGFVKNLHQNFHHEIHGGIIVVQKIDLVFFGLFELCNLFGNGLFVRSQATPFLLLYLNINLPTIIEFWLNFYL